MVIIAIVGHKDASDTQVLNINISPNYLNQFNTF